MPKLTAFLLILSLLPATGSISLQVDRQGSGRLVSAIALPDGGSLALLQDGDQYELAYERADGLLLSQDAPLIGQPVAERALVCGRFVHLFVESTHDAGGQPVHEVWRYRWDLGQDTGLCQLAESYFPFVGNHGEAP